MEIVEAIKLGLRISGVERGELETDVVVDVMAGKGGKMGLMETRLSVVAEIKINEIRNGMAEIGIDEALASVAV